LNVARRDIGESGSRPDPATAIIGPGSRGASIMNFAGISYLAVLIAAVVGWLAGAVWYMAFGKPWMAAADITPDKIEQSRKSGLGFVPFVLAFVADLIMAWILAGIIGHLGRGHVTLINGVISGALCWLGFVITTQAVNYTFGMRKPMLIAIDGGHWLVVLVLMGAIIGGIGV